MEHIGAFIGLHKAKEIYSTKECQTVLNARKRKLLASICLCNKQRVPATKELLLFSTIYISLHEAVLEFLHIRIYAYIFELEIGNSPHPEDILSVKNKRAKIEIVGLRIHVNLLFNRRLMLFSTPVTHRTYTSLGSSSQITPPSTSSAYWTQ